MSHVVRKNRRCSQSVFAFLTALVVLTAAVGCLHTPKRAYIDKYQHAQVEFLDPGLRQAVRVSPPIVARLSDGVLDVAVDIRSTQQSGIVRFEYRATFFDANWMEQNSTAWTAVELSPVDTRQLRFNSISTAAVNFRLSVR